MLKSIALGIGIFILGFIVATLGSGIFNSGSAEFSYYYAIIFSILYLCAIVGISTSLILKELKKSSDS